MVDRSRRSVFAEVAVFTAVILGLIVVAASLWSSREERCHTVFVLKQPVEVSLVADAIKHSRADPQEWWHTFPSGVSGGYFAGKEMSAESSSRDIALVRSTRG